MEVENQSVSTPEVGEAAPATPTPAPSTTETPTPAAASGTESTGEAVVPPTYTPNFKFKHAVVGPDGKTVQEEKEFDEWLKSSIKDEETEKKARELYAKAHGLDFVKKSEEKYKTQAIEVTEKYTNLSKSLDVLSHYVKNGDFDSFFAGLKIDPTNIYKWVNKKIQEAEMTPEQKAEISRQREMQNRLYALEQQNQSLLERFESSSVEQNEAQLDSVLTKPEYSNIAQSFDARVGRPGAFKEEVIKRGVVLYHLNGNQDLPPDEVVKDLLGVMGKVFDPALTTQSAAGAPTNGAPTKPPVIPNIGAKSGSPVKQAPKSLADLNKIKAAMSMQRT